MNDWTKKAAIMAVSATMAASSLPAAAETVGTASYYGKGFHGRRSASGVRFNMNDMTAAHRNLPFGTKLQVTNLRNGRSVVVRVEDRGPFIRGRVLDLSYGAARALDFVRNGTAKVKYERL